MGVSARDETRGCLLDALPVCDIWVHGPEEQMFFTTELAGSAEHVLQSQAWTNCLPTGVDDSMYR